MARLLKCWQCEGKDYDENMVIVQSGSQKKRYHKENCYDKYLEDQAFKEKERKELDELVEVIKDVHEIKNIPNQFYSYLQDIRNGTEMFGRIGQKKSKKGYSYSIIKETYLQHKDTIQWAKNTKDFRGNTMNLLKYTKAIVMDKIDYVAYKMDTKKQQKEFEKAKEHQAENVFEHVIKQPKQYKKSKSKKDASSFLD